MDPFKKIAEECIRQAERVPCTPEEFRLGLATIWHVVQERVEIEGISPRDPEYLKD